MKGIMIQGTSSDAGKSYITTALCRIFADMGYKVAPFKSQNMSNNSYVTIDGCEIGRAQGVQAEAAKVIPNVHMNPILLKPIKDHKSEVVLHGKVYRNYSGMAYRKEFTLTKGMDAVKESLQFIKEQYDLIVIEGAGSPAEVNLNSREIVNMRIAETADVDVILVADIDRGGAFANLVGTLELVFEHRHRIKGVIFNKFRGDIHLLEDGLKWFENYTGVKVVGVIPYMNDIYIETEDSASKHLLLQCEIEKPLDLVVIHMERVSNNTDVETFLHEKDVSVRIVRRHEEFGSPHAVIIPGTKSTIGDLEELFASGMADKIKEYSQLGGNVFGICGGYQVLGETIEDTIGIDIEGGKKIEGLGLLPVKTIFVKEKQVKVVKGRRIEGNQENVSGYEIHLGRTEYIKDAKPFIQLESENASKDIENDYLDGCISKDGNCIGTYLHNIFNNDEFRNWWLNSLRVKYKLPEQPIVDTSMIKKQSYDLLAKRVKESIDMAFVMELIENSKE